MRIGRTRDEVHALECRDRIVVGAGGLPELVEARRGMRGVLGVLAAARSITQPLVARCGHAAVTPLDARLPIVPRDRCVTRRDRARVYPGAGCDRGLVGGVRIRISTGDV